MSSSSPPSVSPALEEKIYRVGTLRYSQHDLYVLFFWLMWNDFTITLLEQVHGLLGFLYKDYGASNAEIATFGSITGLISMWINPWCSTWSDRTRTKYGRRRPFVFFATPFFALFLMLIPYMPGLYRALMHYPLAAGMLHHIPIKGEVLFIFICAFVAGAFNSMVLAIFSYLYWDVVPASVLGRFNGLAKIVTSLAAFAWNFFFFGLGEHHMKAVFVGVSVFCLLFYLISTWQIKEGEYPPPDKHKKGGGLAPVRAYFVECFSQPYFLWIFLGFTLYQLNNLAGQSQIFYLHYDLGLSLDSIGKMRALPLIVSVALAFAIGAMTDKFNPVRLLAPTYLIWGAFNFAGYFFVQSQWSFLVLVTGTSLMATASGIVTSAVAVRIYPMEKLGQFSSACAISQQLTCGLVAPFMGVIFDHTSNRVGFLWSADFLFAAALVFRTVYFNWKKRHGHAPVPHAG
jgi:Na+/melibiose symporter-like transporter